jgi:hypothetical protein
MGRVTELATAKKFALFRYCHKIEIMKSKDAVAALGALAHELRLSVFREAGRTRSGRLTPGDLIPKLGIPAPTPSFDRKRT